MVKNLLANAGDVGLIPGFGRCPAEGKKKKKPHSSILAWETPMDRGNLVGYSPWGHKELDTT